MTLLELIQRSLDIASEGITTTSTRLAMEIAAEPLVAIVFNDVSGAVAANPGRRSLLRRAVTIPFVNGVGAVPETVFTEHLDESLLYDPSDTTSRYSWVSQFSELVRVSDMRIGYYSVNESAIYVVQAGANYDPVSGLIGNLSLITPASVEVPTTVASTVVVRDELLDDITQALAAAIRTGANIART